MIPASDLFGIAAGIVALVALLIFVSAVRTARRAQLAAYYTTRRNAQRSANRRLLLAILTFGLAGALGLSSLLMPRPAMPKVSSLDEIDTANTASVEPMLIIYPTPVAVAAGLAAEMTQPTAAPTPSPTPQATPIPEPTSALIGSATTSEGTSAAGRAHVLPGQRLALNAIASGIDANGAPIGAGTTFTRGVETIYIFFDFWDVPPSALLRHSWFRNGGSVFFRSKRLTTNGQGTDYVSWSPPDGFAPGLYEVRITLGGVPQFVANFEVR
ncbi:MAG: hypothetical protein NZM18_04075 [Thermoflexales bacterium]|nr:hypothetical protein [Thermoflexales bacterium]